PRARKPGLLQQGGKLAAASLAASAADHQHLHIHERSRERRIRPFNDGLADEHTTARPHDLSYVTEDLQRTRVVPVVQDVFDYIGIAATGNALEHIATDDLDTVDHTTRVQEIPGHPCHTRSLKQDTAEVRMRCQHVRQERPTPTCNVTDSVHVAKGVD